MGILSSRISVTRYKVTGKLEGAIHETVYQCLKKHVIPKIESESLVFVAGWTSLENPYLPDFEGYSFVFGAHMVFSLRIDKKSIPTKLVQKHYELAVAKRQADTGRQQVSNEEKKAIKEYVINTLNRRIPATPHVYDLVWHYPEASLWFFSNLKAANETLENLFIKSFGLGLIRLFPYTTADILSGLSNAQRDLLRKLAPTQSENYESGHI